MNAEVVNTPAIRSWRDIPQPVKPRAMSRAGRWRQFAVALRWTAGGLFAAGFAWGTWVVAGALGRAPRDVPRAARGVPVRHLELRTSAGGVLDEAWLWRTLALPSSDTLLELDLPRLRARLLAEGQVATAAITRQFPDRLIVRLTERMPVARVRVEFSGLPRDLLVAPDGFVFTGTGFDPAMLATLPWLSGIALVPDGAGFRPIPGMQPVAQLLADSQFSAMHLYQAWMSVSLARLAVDRELEVTTRNGTTIVFNATGEFFVQLATLDYLLEKLADTPMARAHIDLTLGRHVPVMIDPPLPLRAGPGAASAGSNLPPSPVFSVIPPPRS